jgi:hypothetical protein
VLFLGEEKPPFSLKGTFRRKASLSWSAYLLKTDFFATGFFSMAGNFLVGPGLMGLISIDARLVARDVLANLADS